jgi:hypothetical protein
MTVKLIRTVLFSLLFCISIDVCPAKNLPHSDPADNLYLGGEYEGNYVWGAAMNLAWNDLCENILGEKLILKSPDEKALLTARKLNTGFFTRNDLDEASFYVKSGFGSRTVALINSESLARFPEKSFKNLEIQLADTAFIAYAYFLKQVEYPVRFKETDVTFEGESVKGFYAGGNEQKANIVILKYLNEDHFIIRLELKDKADQLILAKGFDMNDPSEVLGELVSLKSSSFEGMSKHDIFQMPRLHLNHHRDYVEMIGQALANEKYKGFIIAQMFENIKFDLDHKGARVENEAVIAIAEGARMELSQSKRLVLDKPFWVIMKRRASSHPYFILGAKNSKVMEKA